MKITFNESTGEITACVIDEQSLQGSITVPDNLAVFFNIDKYVYLNSVFSLKPYILLSPSVSSAVVGSEVGVSVRAFTGQGELDASADGNAVITSLEGSVVTAVQLVSGAATFNLTSDMPKTVYVRAQIPLKYSAPANVVFTAE